MRSHTCWKPEQPIALVDPEHRQAAPSPVRSMLLRLIALVYMDSTPQIIVNITNIACNPMTVV